MTRPSPIWRGILWVERFLPSPSPSPPTPLAEPSPAAKRRAALVVQVVLLAIAVPSVVRHRQEIVNLIGEKRVALEQLMLVLAVCVAMAAVAFGTKAWRDAEGAR